MERFVVVLTFRSSITFFSLLSLTRFASLAAQFFDSDNSGRVSASELASGLTLALDSSPADRRLLIFRMWDRDGSGSLTKAEFTDLLVGWYSTLPTPDPTQTPERIRKNAEAFFDKLDANGDGVMTFEEFDMAVEKGGEGMEWLSSVLG